MKNLTSTVIVFCALGMAGCSGPHYASAPTTSHTYATMQSDAANNQRTRARKTAHARKTAQVRKAALVQKTRAEHVSQQSQDSPSTVGSTAAAQPLVPYSREWWTQERAREARDSERLKRVMQICRGC